MTDSSISTSAHGPGADDHGQTSFLLDQAPKSRDDLSFTKRIGRGDDEPGSLENWSVEHSQEDYWHQGVERGERFAREVTMLALVNETEAYDAIRFALGSKNWSGSWGEEAGFADAIARLALAGIRSLSAGAAPFEPVTPAVDD